MIKTTLFLSLLGLNTLAYAQPECHYIVDADSAPVRTEIEADAVFKSGAWKTHTYYADSDYSDRDRKEGAAQRECQAHLRDRLRQYRSKGSGEYDGACVASSAWNEYGGEDMKHMSSTDRGETLYTAVIYQITNKSADEIRQLRCKRLLVCEQDFLNQNASDKQLSALRELIQRNCN